MAQIYECFATETFDDKGLLTSISYHIPDHFNFGFDVVDEVAKKSPDRRAMVWVGDDFSERVFTFRDMMEKSNQTANFFRAQGIERGDRVMLILKRNYQFWFSMVALHKLGAVAIPATDQLLKKDLVYRFNAAGVKAVVCTGQSHIAGSVEESLEESPTLELKILVGQREGWLDFDAEIAKQSTEFDIPREERNQPGDPMLMYFTSGTTGYPKIATHSFTYPLGHIITARNWHNVDPDGLHLAVSDTGWGKAVWGKLYGQWLCEACVFTYDFDRFNADHLLEMIQKYRITTFCAPPTIYRFLIKEDLSRFDLSSLKYATIAGEALNPEVFYQFQKATGIKLMEGFGQTETTLTVANLYGMEPKPGSMGKPSPGYEVLLLDSEGNPVKTGETGEVCISTKNGAPVGMFIGYYRDEEKTKEAWHDGAYHTGDMAWRDEDGYLWYVGRTDDLIKSSGYRIGPFEIESVLMELPYILECAVTGTPHPVRGQVVKATIVLIPGKEGTEELKKEIQEYVKDHTAPYKYPRVVEFVESLPKTISGKIRRVELK